MIADNPTTNSSNADTDDRHDEYELGPHTDKPNETVVSLTDNQQICASGFIPFSSQTYVRTLNVQTYVFLGGGEV